MTIAVLPVLPQSLKVDQYFEGNHLIIHKRSTPDTYSFFVQYLNSHDNHFWARPELWLFADGTIPTCAWFITCDTFSPVPSLANQCGWEVLCHLQNWVLPRTL